MHLKFLIAAAFAIAAGAAFAHGEEKHGENHNAPPAAKETAFGRAADPAKAQRTILVEMRDGYQFSPDTHRRARRARSCASSS